MTACAALSLALLLTSLAPAVRAQTQPGVPLANLEFDVLGVRLVPSPTALTVPKNIPTRVNAELVVPAGATAEVDAAIATLADGAEVHAELRGPGIPPIPIRVAAGQPLPIPALALPGDYFLDQIRLVKGGEVLLDGTPNAVPIRVIAEILVTSVSSRPLSIDEIREKGIVIDGSNFSAYEFQLALNVDGIPFTIRAPVAFPSREFDRFRSRDPEFVTQLQRLNLDLLQTATIELPPELERPGLNFGIAAIPFMPAGDEGTALPFSVPPITGLVLTAGNVSFLNQFTSMLLLAANVAPDGSNLVLRDVEGEIALPTGLDRVPGASYESPGDDPLRLARIEGIGQVPVLPILAPGADGTHGTADDDPRIVPQASGRAEFLVEGLLEGNHTVDFALRAVLDGLPSGPVELVGNAVGAILVRNPTFSITLSHPATVRAFEPYDLWAVVTNTSAQPANLVSLNLEANSISGTVLAPGQAPTAVLDTIPPGEAREARFRMIAQKTGQVTFGVFNSEPGLTGNFQLRTGIGERDVPLSPNAIVLPTTTQLLPDALIVAAQRVLGQALSIATAPTLPPGVLWMPRRVVVTRALELAEAAQRVEFGEPLGRVARDLLLDWLGARAADPGFDQLLRETEAGAAFAAALGAIMEAERGGATLLELERAIAESTVAREPYLAAIAGSDGGPAPVRLRLLDSQDRAADELGRALPHADRFPLQASGDARADLAVVARLDSPSYVVELEGTASGAFDLGVLVPGPPGEIVQVRFAGVPIAQGDVARLVISLVGPNPFSLRVDRGGDGSVDETLAGSTQTIVESAPTILTVRQLENTFGFGGRADSRDPARYGLVIGVLFDKPVAEASAENVANYAIPANAVVGGALQASGRLVYLILQKPVGTLVPRALTARDVEDARGNALAETTRPIEMVWDDGARVFGQLRNADGTGVGNAVFSLGVVCGQGGFHLATIRTDPDGGFDFDHVKRLSCGGVSIFAQHPDTLDFVNTRAVIRAPGQLLLLNPTFLGRGTVRGRVLESDGVTPVAGALVKLWGDGLNGTGFHANADAAGGYTISGVPVGLFRVFSSNAAGDVGYATGELPTDGADAVTDVIVASPATALGRLVGRAFRSDGQTPAEGLRVLYGSLKPDFTMDVFDETTSDAAGGFAFEGVEPRGYDVVAFDVASDELGYARQVPVQAGLTASANVVLRATGAVEGVVRDAQGFVVAGALVAGGSALGVTDANGFFRIEGVPPGDRTIDAGNPVTRRRGSASVTVLPGRTASAAITLEARATIVGRVLDANGNPVPRATVRLPSAGGFRFVFANNAGFYRFPDIELGSHLIQAPGPSQAALIEFMRQEGIPLERAFTAIPPDYPPDLAEAAPPAVGVDATVSAFKSAVQSFYAIDTAAQTELPVNTAGGFGWSQVALFQDSVTVNADVRYLAQGTVSGTTVDANDAPVAAAVQIIALGVGGTGLPRTQELGRTTTAPDVGTFSFGPIARFDLETFQTTGIRSGDLSLTALQPFSPAAARFAGQLNANNPNLSGILLRFPALADTSGTITGRVFLPDGVTPAPPNTEVRISFGDLTVRTDAEGRFANVFPIPAGVYVLTALEPVSGLQGQASVRVPEGGNVDAEIRLLGLGAVSVVVQRPNGQPVPNAEVELVRAGFPGGEFDGVTGADGQVRFQNLTEGHFGVVGRELGTGLVGRASGTVLRDGEVAALVTVEGAGSVSGRFVSVLGAVPIPNAQIELRSGATSAFSTTDAEGRFALDAIPVGPFEIEASDPVTGRAGRADGQIRFQGDATDVTVVQGARGSVTGIVLNSDGVSPIPGARVRIDHAAAVLLFGTAGPDGAFRFDGVPDGDYAVGALDPLTGFRGEASGRVRFEGELVRQDVLIEGYNAIRVRVLDADGVTPVGNAEVRIATAFVPGQAAGQEARSAGVATDGTFTFERLPLRIYDLSATSLSQPHSGVNRRFALDAAAPFGTCVENPAQVCRDDSECAGADRCDTPAVSVDLVLRGVGAVEVAVVESDGATPVASARVTLRASARLPSETGRPSPAADTFLGFTDATGRVTFPDVPFGVFDVSGESGPLGGVASGVVDTPGATLPVTVELGESGTVRGRVLLPDGTTLAAETFVTLEFETQSGLSTGVVQVTTGLLGAFEFAGIPLGEVTLTAFEQVSRGVRRVRTSLDTGGQLLDLGDLVLDNTSPRVLSIAPADGAANVPVGAAIELVFSEPVDPATVRVQPPANVFLQRGQISLPATLQLLDGNTRAVVTPVDPLESSALYTLTVLGVPLGPRDPEGLSLLDPFVASFSAADVIPPELVSQSPASGERQILPEAVVRLGFSEALGSGFALVLRDDAGTPVPGAVTTALGDTVAIFTPTDFLAPNRSYRVELAGATDVAGNPLVGGELAYDFFAVDTIAPDLASLALAGAPSLRAGSLATLLPQLTATDVARVEYLVDGAPVVAASAPFALDVLLPLGAGAVDVRANAIDRVGNRSLAATLSIPIAANAPPAIAAFSNACGATARQRTSCLVQVEASDDAALGDVVFSAQGAVNASQTRAFAPGLVAGTLAFTLQIPADAPSGGEVLLRAVARDAELAASAPATLALQLADGVAPNAAILAPVNGAAVLPGQSVDVVVTASDDVALESLGLDCTPALAGCGAVAIAPATLAAQRTFTLQIPQDAVAPFSVALAPSARDSAQNSVAGVPRALVLVDLVAPELLALSSLSGSTAVVPGQLIAARAEASDNVAVTAVEFSIDGLPGAGQTVPVTPAAAQALVDFAFAIPVAAPNGSTFTLRARARDARGNTSAERTLVFTVGDVQPPAVEILAPGEGASVAPGSNLALEARATDDVAVSRIEYVASGAVVAQGFQDFAPPITPANAAFSLPIPAGATPGEVLLSVLARDVSGNPSATAERRVNVLDVGAPMVAITSPLEGAQIDPRNPLDVVVSASDAGGLIEIRLGDQVRVLQPAVPSATETFSVSFDPLPATGGQRSFVASARDAAGNTGSSATLTIALRDVVAPAVTEVDPAAGSVDVPLESTVVVTFSEPVDPATVTSATARLEIDGAPLAAALALSAGNTLLTLDPAAFLPPLATVTLRLAAGITDPVGNPLADTAVVFTTESSDVVGPRVQSVAPADGAPDVSVGTSISVRFDEAIARASVTPQSFAVTANGQPVAGALAFQDADRVVRFTPDADLPLAAAVETALSSGIEDLFGNELTDAAGNPLASPLRFAFTTASFELTNPDDGGFVLEDDDLVLEARASATLGVASVVFAVNGVALPPVSGPSFQAAFRTPLAAAVPSLAIEASARNASGVEIAGDTATVSVVRGLRLAPDVLGVPVGGAAEVTLSLSSPLAVDLAVALAPLDPARIALPTQVVIPAGSLEARVAVDGIAVGATSLVATSALGADGVVVAVSVPLSGQTIDAIAPAPALQIVPLQSAGSALVPALATLMLDVPLLASPAAADTPVSVASSNPLAVSAAPGAFVPQGSTLARVSITSGAAGIAELTLRAGAAGRTFTVFVGSAPPDRLPAIVAAPVGIAVRSLPSAGTAIVPVGQAPTLTIDLLAADAAVPTPVSVTTSDAGVANVGGPVVIPAGSGRATFTLVTGVAGSAQLTFRVGLEGRTLDVIVGAAPEDRVPAILAPAVGVAVTELPSAGAVVIPAGQTRTIGVELLAAPAAGATPVGVTTSDLAIASVAGAPSVPAGSRRVELAIAAGAAGNARLVLRAGGDARTLDVFVDAAPDDRTPAVASPPVCIEVGSSAVRCAGSP